MSIGNYCGSRPGSFYDNYGGEEDNAYNGYADDKYDKLRNEMLGFERAKSPTQTISLLTTVPQNITPQNIAGRHAPTRHSLRHSRMIVMNRLGPTTVPNKLTTTATTPPMQRFHKFAKVLVSLQFFLGLGIGAIAFWIFVFAPNIRQRDNPYWSGVPLTASGVVGFLLFCCPRTEYPKRSSRNTIAYAIKVLSIFLSVIAGVVCLIASVFAFLHLIALAFMDCEPAIHFNNTCLCTMSNATTLSTSLPTFVIQDYHYTDLQCPELNDFFVFLMIASCGCNLIGAVIALWYVYLHWSSRFLYAYSKVHNNNSGPVVLQN